MSNRQMGSALPRTAREALRAGNGLNYLRVSEAVGEFPEVGEPSGGALDDGGSHPGQVGVLQLEARAGRRHPHQDLVRLQALGQVVVDRPLLAGTHSHSTGKVTSITIRDGGSSFLRSVLTRTKCVLTVFLFTPMMFKYRKITNRLT